jgi:hypothetical protein
MGTCLLFEGLTGTKADADGETEFASDRVMVPASAAFYPLARFFAFFSARFSFSDFCACFLPSFFGLSWPFMQPILRLTGGRS